MRDEWFPHIAFPIPWKQFHELPKSPVYKWEYWDGQAHLTARPKAYSCVLHLTPKVVSDTLSFARDEVFRFRPIAEGDWEQLPHVFSAAFSHVPPFCGMEDDASLSAAGACLDKTKAGGDGPLIHTACFVAAGGDEELCGAALVTLHKDIDLSSLDDPRWKTPPPEALERKLGRPHLTWIFVPPLLTRHGLGTVLLSHSINALLGLGYQQLASTFLLGNESSTLWHWMNGFQLVTWMGSPRAIQRRVNTFKKAPSSSDEGEVR